MKKFIFYLSYCLIFLLSLLPLWVLYLLSDFIFLIIFYVMKYRRRLVFKNMSDSFPNKSEEEIRVLERRFYHWFCDYLVESIKLLTISKQQLKRRMVFKGTDTRKTGEIRFEGCSIYSYIWNNVATFAFPIK